MNTFKITGVLFGATKEITVGASNTRKRSFQLEIEDGKYTQTPQFDLLGDRCDKLKGMKKGDKVTVEFALRGRQWQDKYITSLFAWDVKPYEEAKSEAEAEPSADDTGLDEDLPF